MIITNKAGLPAAFVKAVEKQMYTNKNYSITSLQKSPRQFWITKKKFDEIEVEAADCLWLLFGSAMHKVLEEGTEANVTEKALDYLIQEDIKITGVMDLYQGGYVSDWKTASIWTFIFKDKFKEWEEQLNGYSFLLRANGFKPKSLKIHAILKDWKENDKKRQGADYPDSDFQTLEFPQWDFETQKAHFTAKALNMYGYKDTDLSELPECDNEYKWQRPTKYAVMKETRKTAIKVYENEHDAENHAAKEKGGYVEVRPSLPTRCIKYCSAAQFCSQHQEWLDNGGRELIDA